MGKSTISPGPGAYLTKSFAFDIEKPRFFMGEKIKDTPDKLKTPGPGNYNPKIDSV